MYCVSDEHMKVLTLLHNHVIVYIVVLSSSSSVWTPFSIVIHHPQCFLMLNNLTLPSDPGMSVGCVVCNTVSTFVHVILCITITIECMNVLTLLHNHVIVHFVVLPSSSSVCGLHSPSSSVIHSVLCSTIQRSPRILGCQ